ncbi:hypothetical protein SAMN06265375_101618 [Muriicola jejuensis]|uniref:Lipoprotein n=1 Tax=Muriicola jejuensis TaxID=504488 RepID=A0A6P0UB89_9FLAO|nr:hypothetical protein [Muriicola jejuensis]NER09862.1 hypothetical protein [Muriicola jejuensis]SMP05139.1 hypothetical protein SAMN06265375_101618 [Muriicola jejuensis]
MSLKKSIPLLLCFVVFGLSSCKLEDDRVNFRFVPLQILSADVPEAFELNETYEIRVRYLRPSACVFFEGFDITKEGVTTRNVVAIGTDFYDEVCTQAVEEQEASFNFICLYEDTYLFRFWTGEDENGNQQYLEVEVPVN